VLSNRQEIVSVLEGSLNTVHYSHMIALQSAIIAILLQSKTQQYQPQN